MNKVIPKRTVRLRRESDMINYRIEEMKKKRDRVMKKARAKNDENLWTVVKKLDKDIKCAVKQERQNVIQ